VPGQSIHKDYPFEDRVDWMQEFLDLDAIRQQTRLHCSPVRNYLDFRSLGGPGSIRNLDFLVVCWVLIRRERQRVRQPPCRRYHCVCWV
jgi:hypothetical protein